MRNVVINLQAIIRGIFEKAKDELSGPVLCSECFSDLGLRMEAEKIGRQTKSKCPNCSAAGGTKLYQYQLEQLMVEFFWNGSFFRSDFGGAHRLVSNPYRYGEREVVFPSWLEADAHLLEDKLKVGLFHYGPALWRIGEVEPLVNLRNTKTRSSAIKNILSSFPERNLAKGARFYRIRKNLNPQDEANPLQYDAPPSNRTSLGRLDSKSLPVLYGSDNLEICVHECRILIPDECFVATLRPTRELRMLDLTAEPKDDGPTPFESLDLAMRYLFAAEGHSYEITRSIARAARREGFDGIYYPSYFSLVKDARIANIAVFGHPVAQKYIEVECINRAQLKASEYKIRMGPIFS